MTSVAERYSIERAKWDAHAQRARADAKPLPPDADFAWYCRTDRLLVGVEEHLGDLIGKRVVEYGCGLGRSSILLARSGARVSAFDLSEESVEVARERAHEAGLDDRIEFAVASAEALPYEDASFDIAFGKAVLHHLDPDAGAPELARILKPRGRAAFSEPLGTNFVVQAVRDHVPYPYKHERGADIPLRRRDVDAWLEPFAEASIRGVQLLSMVERGFGFKRTFPTLRRADDALLGRWPGLWPLCRYAVLTMVR